MKMLLNVVDCKDCIFYIEIDEGYCIHHIKEIKHCDGEVNCFVER